MGVIFHYVINKPVGLWEHLPSIQALALRVLSGLFLPAQHQVTIYLPAIVCRLCTSWLLISGVLSEFDCVYLVRQSS